MTTRSRRCLGRGSSFVLLIGLALTAGCTWRSAPVRFYVLAEVPRPTAAAPSAEPSRGPTVGVGPITLPRYLERSNIVTRRGAELEVAEYDRWGEPLSDSVPRAIAADLSTLLQTERIVIFPWSGASTIDQQVVVDVLRFDGIPGGDVLLEARWRVLGQGKKELVLRYSTVREATGEPGYPALVAAMSRSVGLLSREIAAAVRALGAPSACGGSVPCARSGNEPGGGAGSAPPGTHPLATGASSRTAGKRRLRGVQRPLRIRIALGRPTEEDGGSPALAPPHALDQSPSPSPSSRGRRRPIGMTGRRSTHRESHSSNVKSGHSRLPA